MSSAGPQRHDHTMDFWRESIDPRLLEQNVAQVGGFMIDVMQADGSHMPLDAFEHTLDQPAHMGMDSEMTALHAELSDMDRTAISADLHDYELPVMPQRDIHFLYRDPWNTATSSLRADASVFQPGSRWHIENRFAVLANTANGAFPPCLPYPNRTSTGMLTPDSASTSQLHAARRGSLRSPTHNQRRLLMPAGRRFDATAMTATNSVNMNGVPVNAPAAQNIEAWAGEAYNVPGTHSAAHLEPQAAFHSGRRSRATSVSSTYGQGAFACDGATGKPCGKRFVTRSALTHHARCHKPPRQFCSICDAGFYYMKDLTRHMRTHGPRDRHLICNNIGCKYHTTPFAREDHLERHKGSCRHSQS